MKELHSYDLPECVMLEVAAGSSEYLEWIAENTDLTTEDTEVLREV